MPTVLIAVDGSALDTRLARTTLDLFGDRATYVVVNVADEPHAMSTVPVAHGVAAALSYPEFTHWADGLDAAADRATGVAEQVASSIERVGGTAEASGEVGDPISVILQAADEHDADLIVLGSHERNWFSRVLEPSVSDHVTSLADRPVMIVADT